METLSDMSVAFQVENKHIETYVTLLWSIIMFCGHKIQKILAFEDFQFPRPQVFWFIKSVILMGCYKTLNYPGREF